MSKRATPPIIYLGLLIAGLAAFALHTIAGVGGRDLDGLFEAGLYNVLMFGAALAVLARGFAVERQRPAWLAMGVGVLAWSAGELYYSLFIEGTSAEAVGSVSLADAMFLAMYPCLYVGLGLIARERLRRVPVGVWLDGLIAGLAAATIAAALLLPPVLDNARGNLASVVVSTAYPLGDLVLLLFAVGVLGISGWRPGRVWLLIAMSMLVSAVADSVYLYQTATGTFKQGTWLDCLWPAAAIMIAIAAWTPHRQPEPRTISSWETISAPAVGLLSSVGVLAYGNVAHQLSAPVLALAMGTLMAVGVQLVLTTRENLTLLARSERLSLTDPLTGLGNRRRLINDLRVACVSAEDGSRWELVLYDLDGFKRYNDAFGHPAGDAVLIRLAERLMNAVTPHGIAYRMGGDEFCVLFERSGGNESLVKRSVAALSERGPGFAITASHGSVLIPAEARDPGSIVQVADQRLYRNKQVIAAQHVAHDSPGAAAVIAASAVE